VGKTAHAASRPRSFIRELCTAVAHRWEPERLFVILTAYFDESGTHGGSPVTIMGGVMATANKLARFEVGFDKMRKRYGFQVFHTKKFFARSGDFKGWRREKCGELIVDMAALTENPGFTDGITFELTNEEYEAEVRSEPVPKGVRLDTKYGFCFRFCVSHFVLEMDRRFPKQSNRLHVVIENGHKNVGDAARIFKEMKAGGFPLGELTIAEKDESPPLMVADFIAHMAFKRETGGPKWNRHTNDPFVPGQASYTRYHLKPGAYGRLKRELFERARRAKNDST
jgi:hypothetical protein